jgi:hypothetical protein
MLGGVLSMRVSVVAFSMLFACGRLEFDDSRAPDASDATPDAVVDAAPQPVPAFVQGAVNQVATNPQTLAFPATVAAGDLIVVAVGALSQPNTNLSDTFGSTFTLEISFDNAVAGSFGYVWVGHAAGSGAESITVTYGSADEHTLELLEYVHAGALDHTASGSGNGSSLDTDPLTTSADGDLVVAFTHQDNATTWTPAAGFTTREDNMHTFTADELVGSAGVYAVHFDADVAQAWDLHALAFLAAP